MKKTTILWAFLSCLILAAILVPMRARAASGDVAINSTNFPDEKFRAYVTSQFDTDKDGVLSAAEIKTVTFIGIVEQGVTTLKGVEYFTSLESLYCMSNKLTSLDVSGLSTLTVLNVSKNTELKELDCSGCGLVALYVGNCQALLTLDCSANQLDRIDVSTCTALVELNCSKNQLETLTIEGCTALQYLFCFDNQLTEISFVDAVPLKILSCANNKLTNLIGLSTEELIQIDCSNNRLEKLSIINSPTLKVLIAKNNPSMTVLECRYCGLTSLKVDGCTGLEELNCSGNALESLDIVDLSSLRKLYCDTNKLSSLYTWFNKELVTLDCSGNQIESLNLRNNTSLVMLYCLENQLTSLDVSQNTKLEMIFCYQNQLASLDVSLNTELVNLYCQNNELKELNVRKNTKLMRLICHDNQLKTLDVSQNPEMTYLSCHHNDIEVLNISPCPNLLKTYMEGERNEYSTDRNFVIYTLNGVWVLGFDSDTVLRTEVFKWTRLAGSDRYGTMAKVTQTAFADHSCKTIIVATGQSFPDALSGAGLAGVYRCPIVLTKKASLSPEAESEIKRLAATYCNIFILGGEGTVSANVENRIKELGLTHLTVTRLYGDNREGTAIAVYEQGKKAKGFKEGGTVIIATGYSYADVLSISPYAYASKTPILLAKKDGSLSADTKALIESEKFTKAIIIGGTGSVSLSAEKYLQVSRDMKVLRLEGDNRYETSGTIMRWELGMETGAAFQPEVLLKPEGMGCATGASFADALGSVTLLGKNGSPLLLVSDSNKANALLTETTIAALVSPCTNSMTQGYIFGGTSTVSTKIESWLNSSVK